MNSTLTKLNDETICGTILSSICEQAVNDYMLLRATGIIQNGSIIEDRMKKRVGGMRKSDVADLHHFIHGDGFKRFWMILDEPCDFTRAKNTVIHGQIQLQHKTTHAAIKSHERTTQCANA